MKHTRDLAVCVFVVVGIVCATHQAMAGTITATFLDGPEGLFTDWLVRATTRLVAIAILIVAGGYAVVKQDFVIFLAGIGVAGAAFFGSAMVAPIFSAPILIG